MAETTPKWHKGEPSVDVLYFLKSRLIPKKLLTLFYLMPFFFLFFFSDENGEEGKLKRGSFPILMQV